jgi:hypothetical protein
MSFAKTDRSLRTSRDMGPVFAIGRRAFVNCPEGGEGRISLLDEAGTAVVDSLLDGTEVEIVAWKPRGTATRYFVRVTSRETTGWVGVAQLRSDREKGSVQPAGKPAPAAGWVPARSPSEVRRASDGGAGAATDSKTKRPSRKSPDALR